MHIYIQVFILYNTYSIEAQLQDSLPGSHDPFQLLGAFWMVSVGAGVQVDSISVFSI